MPDPSLEVGSIHRCIIVPEDMISFDPQYDYFPEYYERSEKEAIAPHLLPPQYYLDNWLFAIAPEQYEWLTDNAVGPWVVFHADDLGISFLSFSNDDDLLKFKLRWDI